MKKLVTVLIVSLLFGCAEMSTKTGTGIGMGAVIGGVAGYAVCNGKKSKNKAACIAAGALAGAVIGGMIGQYLTEQDQQNISNTLDDTDNTDPVAWCSDSKKTSHNVENVQCKNTNKIVATPQTITKNDYGNTCRDIKTDVEMPNGNIETSTQTVCKSQDGKWHPQTA